MNRGLIEAVFCPLGIAVGCGLPRFMNRGLIEAVLHRDKELEVDALPRFMNRGLIEACTLDSRRTACRNFPDS